MTRRGERAHGEGGRGRGWIATARMLALTALMAAAIVPTVFLLLPLPEGAEGITLCLPGIGPMQQFAAGLDEDVEELVHIHERIHAEQCRRLGSLAFARAYLRDEGMLTLEAEAFCAEAHTLALRGHDTRSWVSRIVEALYHDYPHAGRVGYPDIVRIVQEWCPTTAGASPRPREAPARPFPTAPSVTPGGR